MKRFSIITTLVIAVACSALRTDAAIKFYYKSENYVPFARCNGGLTPGGTRLLPLTLYQFSEDPRNDPVLAMLQSKFSKDKDGHNWVYHYAVLPGETELWVDWYKAVDKENGAFCDHSAQISVHFSQQLEGFDWIQIYRGSGTPGLDNKDNDGNSPYYFTPAETDAVRREKYCYDTPPANTLVFGDTPGWPNANGGHAHVEANSFFWHRTFDLLLEKTTWDAATSTHNVTIYGDMMWGYEASCVPEPTTLIIWSLLGGLGIAIGWRRKRKAA